MSNTPTSSAQVAEGLNLEAEHAAPELKPCPFCAGYDEHVANEGQNSFVTCLDCNTVGPVVIGGDRLAIAAWNRRAAPVAEGVALPPLPEPGIDVFRIKGFTAEQVRQAQRDARAAGFGEGWQAGRRAPRPPGPAQRAKQPAQSIDTDEFIKLLGDWGQCAWGNSANEEKAEKALRALIAYIDGRTAGPAVPEGYVIVPIDPTPEMVEAAFVGVIEDQDVSRQIKRREAMAKNYRAMIAAAPKPQEDA